MDYDFTDCVIENIAAKVGCRYPWDKRSHSRVPVCNDLSKIEEQETIFYKLSLSERKELVNKSGCFPPCRYREYKIFSEDMEGLMPGYGVGFMFLSTDFALEEEDYVYPFISFVAEFGGALGMFLGFSFLMVWDVVLAFIHASSNKIK